MNGNTSFYYGDDAGNPVGPLSLNEIQNFVNAGLISPDVQVCEAGGRHWQSLGSIGNPLATSSTEAGDTNDPAHASEVLKLTYTIALAASLVAFGLDAVTSRAALENNGIDPNRAREVFALLAFLLALGATLTLLYQLVRCIPPRHRFTSPVKAAGFCLIPIFSIYWVFHIFHGFVISIRKWGNEIAPTLSARISWLHPFAFIAAGIVGFTEVLGYFEIAGYFDHSILRIARTNHMMISLADAACYAVFFHFMLSLVQLIRGILHPEDENEFFSTGPVKWRPSYAYALFFIIAIAAWR